MANRVSLTEADKEKIIQLYNTHECARKDLAKRFGVSRSTIDKILTDNRHAVTLKQPNTRFSVDEDLWLVRLYKAGTPIKHIADIMGRSLTSVYNRAIGLGIHVSKSNRSHYVGDGDAFRKISDAIRPEDILQVRTKVKVGDILQVKTVKAVTDALGVGYTSVGVMRDARVVSIDHPRFCLLELVDSGLMESKLWVDMVLEQRALERVERAGGNV